MSGSLLVIEGRLEHSCTTAASCPAGLQAACGRCGSVLSVVWAVVTGQSLSQSVWCGWTVEASVGDWIVWFRQSSLSHPPHLSLTVSH